MIEREDRIPVNLPDAGMVLIKYKDKILVGRKGAAELLDVSRRTIDNLVLAGALQPKRIGNRVLFLRADIEKLAKKGHSTK